MNFVAPGVYPAQMKSLIANNADLTGDVSFFCEKQKRTEAWRPDEDYISGGQCHTQVRKLPANELPGKV